MATAQGSCEEYLGCKLADSTEQRAQFTELRKKFIDQLVSNMNNEDISLLSAMAVLDMETLPTDGLAEYGIDKLELLLDYYGVEKEGTAAFVDADTYREEWVLLK